MRTLKKVLALTVVLATVFSLTAFAAFTDADQINESCQDDINLMNALNVMVGDAEGTFRPNGTISRAEAAKMVYVVRNGGVDDKASGWTGMKVFSDVPAGAWYEGYVNYCASLGIIAGVGGNKFNPDGAVTGVELAKMLLVVAGYKPEVEGYTGANWSLNVIDDAQQANMFEGYALAFSSAAPRQWAAKLFSNTILKTQMALYLGGERVNGAAFMANAQLVGEKYFTLKIANGVLTQIPHVNIAYAGGKSVLDNSNTSIIQALDTNQASGEFVFNAPAELLGQEVKVIYKETGSTDNGLDIKDTVYSMYATGTSNVYDTTMDAITLAVNDNNEATIKLAGYNGGKAALLGTAGGVGQNAYDNRLIVVTNLYNTVKVGRSASAGLNGKYTVDNAAALSSKSTAAVRLVDFDNNGVLDFAFVTAPVYGTVRSYNATRFDFSTAAKFDNKAITSGRKEDSFKNFTFASNIAVDDVVRIDVDVTSGEVLYTVTKVEPTVGSLTHVYSTATDNKIKVGGTDYGFFGGEFNGTAVALNAAGYASDLGKELSLYTDGSYIFHATAGTGNVLGDNFAFVQGYNKGVTSVNGMNNSVTKVQLVLADGKNVICDYLDITGADAAKYYTAAEVATAKNFVGKIVEYKMDGSNVTFYKVPTVAAGGNSNIVYFNNGTQMTYSSSTGIFSRSNLSLKVNDNAVFFMPSYAAGGADFEYSVENAGTNVVIKSVSVYKGNELKGTPKMTPSATAFGKMDLISALQSGIQSVAYGVLDKDTNLSEAGTYAYTTTNSWKVTNDGKTTARVMAVLSDAADAEPVELTLKNNTDTAVGNKVYGVTKNSDGTYSLAELSTGAKFKNDVVKGITADGKTVSVGSSLYNVTSNTKVFVVDMNNNVIGLGDITAAAKDEGGVQSYKNILCEIDDNNNLTTVYVEEYGASVEKLLIYQNNPITATNAITVADLEAGDNISTDALAKALVGNLPVGATLSSVTVEKKSGTGTTASVVAGDKYTITVTLTANLGYEFDNTAAAPAGGTVTLKSTDTFAFSIEKTVTAVKTVIAGTDFTFTDIAAATVNTSLVKNVLPTIAAQNSEFSAGSWSVKKDDSTTALTTQQLDTEVYRGGHTYVAEITLTAANTHKFDAANKSAYEAQIADTNFDALGATVVVTVAEGGATATVKITYEPEKATLAAFAVTPAAAAPTSATTDLSGIAFTLANTTVVPSFSKQTGGSGDFVTITNLSSVSLASTDVLKITLKITPADGYAFVPVSPATDITFSLTGTNASGYTGATLASAVAKADGSCTIELTVTIS